MTGSTLVGSSADASHSLKEKTEGNSGDQDFPKIVRIGTTLSDI